MIRLALYEPEIPQNTGTLLRLGSCLGITLDVIEPCGFGLSNALLRRAGMDYIDSATYKRHASWQEFFTFSKKEGRRLIFLTPSAPVAYIDFIFDSKDTLILGRESSGIPAEVAHEIPYHLKIPMQRDQRSLNVAIAGALVLGEALRQTHSFYQEGVSK